MSLGRGLDSLIPKKVISPTAPLPDDPGRTVGGERIWQLATKIIKVNPHQPRRDFSQESLVELAASIKEHGILQPLIVTEKDGIYELIAGERRWRAAQQLGLATVPAIVRAANESEKLELAIIENVQRQNLNPLEEAAGYQRLLDEFSLTQEEVARQVGKSRAVVANMLRFLALPEEIQQAIVEDKISPSHAKILAGLESADEQLALFKKILAENLNVRATDAAIKRRAGAMPVKIGLGLANAETLAQEEALRQRLGTKVKIEKKGGRGRVIIEFYSEEELRGLIEKI